MSSNKLRMGNFLLIAILGLCVFWPGCARLDVTPFDSKKAETLSAEKRSEYDRIFFNEVVIWNMNGNRYGPEPQDSFMGRKTEFKRMAEDGYLPAYVALRLLDLDRGVEVDDPEALKMLMKAGDEGDVSAMCAFMAIPFNRSMMPYEEIRSISRRILERDSAKRHPACMIRIAGSYLWGERGRMDKKAAMPLLLESAKQGYYGSARALFSLRFQKALDGQFDFADQPELKRALCWGRLAEQHTNHTQFDYFLGLLRDYARANERQDLVKMSKPYDPRHIPITQTVVKPEDCIQLEGE